MQITKSKKILKNHLLLNNLLYREYKQDYGISIQKYHQEKTELQGQIYLNQSTLSMAHLGTGKIAHTIKR